MGVSIGAMLIGEAIMRGAAIGAALAMAASLARSGPSARVRIAGVLFCLSAAAYAVTASSELRAAAGVLRAPIILLSWSGVAFLWLFIRVLFEDRRAWSWHDATPFALLWGIAAFAAAATPGEAAGTLWIVHNLAEMGIALSAAAAVLRGLPGDLVAERRRLRTPFFAATCLYAMALSVGEIVTIAGRGAPDGGILDAAALAFVCLAGAVAFLQPRASLFEASAPAAGGAASAPAADRPHLARLAQIIDAEEGWRREGLTIGALAGEVGVPEHKLRRLINDQLGHRNFADYLNARRIEAAKRALADAAAPVTSISALAFSLGFGSLGPFNRAFKEATGLSPSAWRAQALASGSPNPEKAP